MDRRNTGVGSAASAGGQPPVITFPDGEQTTQPPPATQSPLSPAQAAKLAELYQQLGCLNVGSSAGGINRDYIRMYTQHL